MTKASALAEHCLVCGLPLAGVIGAACGLVGIGRSSRNPNCCTRCNTHIEEGRLVEITVIFADLSSFTKMTRELGATPTYSIVDEFLRFSSGILTSHGAFIDKYIGDAVMAFFNAPVKREDHRAAAVAAASELQQKLPELSKRLGVELKAAVGVASGWARVGRLGSDDIKDYTAIGDVVNQASRLQAQARAGEILVGGSVYDAVAPHFPSVARELLSLKGFADPVEGYRLNGPPASPAGVAPLPAPRLTMTWGSVLLALFGAGCLTSGAAGALTAALGTAAFGGVMAVTEWFDHTILRVPILAASVALAAADIAQAGRERRSGLTPSPWRARIAVGAIAMALLEIAWHWRNDRAFW